jgi:hypothetical protein
VIASKFVYKGIDCVFSEKADAIVPSDEAKIFLLDTFFSYEPINSIEWVDSKSLTDARKDDGSLPMYRIGNGSDELLFWPLLNGSDLWLGIESAEERPDLSEVLEEGGRLKTKS